MAAHPLTEARALERKRAVDKGSEWVKDGANLHAALDWQVRSGQLQPFRHASVWMQLSFRRPE